MKKQKAKTKKRAAVPIANLDDDREKPGPLDDDPEDETETDPEEDSEEIETTGRAAARPFSQRFAEWRDALADDIQTIFIYVYQVVRNGNGTQKRIQAYAFKIARDAEPPEIHDIGIIVGEGDFDIVARTNGREIMRKGVTFGPAYAEMKAERLAQKKADAAAVPAVPNHAPQNPFAGMADAFKALAPILTPVVAAFAAALNPMEGVRRLSTMGEKMAEDAFQFKLNAGKRAAEAAFREHDDDDENDAPAPKSSGANWEEKLADLTDLILWKGKKFLAAQGAEAEKMKDTVKRRVLNDDGFQSLIRDPEQFKKAYSKLCRDCAEIGGAEKVGAILSKLGIKPPVILNRTAPQKTGSKVHA